jgi:hypothetical protein
MAQRGRQATMHGACRIEMGTVRLDRDDDAPARYLNHVIAQCFGAKGQWETLTKDE